MHLKVYSMYSAELFEMYQSHSVPTILNIPNGNWH